MTTLFYIAAAVAVIATVMVVTRTNAIHALLYLVLSLFSLSVVFWTLGAAFAAVLELVIYAGAIVVMFVFVVMLLNPGTANGSHPMSPRDWILPATLAAVLFFQIVRVTLSGSAEIVGVEIAPREVGAALYGPYLLGVELASALLLGGLIAAYRLGRREDG